MVYAKVRDFGQGIKDILNAVVHRKQIAEYNDFVQKHGRPMGWNPQSPTIESFIEQYGWEMKPNRGYGRNWPTTNGRRNTIVLRRMR